MNMLIFIYHHLFKLLRDTDFISFSCFLQMLQSLGVWWCCLSSPVKCAVAPAVNLRAWWATMEALLLENLSKK